MPATASAHSQNATGEPLRVRSTRRDWIDGCGDDFEELDAILPSPPASLPQDEPSENFCGNSTSQEQDTPKEIGPLIRLLRPQPPQRRFEILQQWEGVVTHIEERAVWAELRDLTNPSNAPEVVELPRVEIPKADQRLLQPGCVFYWIMGYETSPGGQVRRVSEVRLRRTPRWSQCAVDAMKAKARSLFQECTGNDEDDSTRAH